MNVILLLDRYISSFMDDHFLLLAIIIGLISLLPVLLIQDEKQRHRWSRRIFWPMIICIVVFSMIIPVEVMETMSADYYLYIGILINTIIICLWVSFTWGHDKVGNKLLRLLIVLVRSVVLAIILNFALRFVGLMAVMIITGQGGA